MVMLANQFLSSVKLLESGGWEEEFLIVKGKKKNCGHKRMP